MPARTWRSPLRLLQFGSIVLPALVIGVWGVVSWGLERDRAFEQARRNAELLREYTLRVLETQHSLLDEAAHLTRDLDLETVSEAQVHEQLRPLIGRLRFTLGVGVVSSDGRVVGSTSYPVAGRADDRAYFRALRDDDNLALFIERARLPQSSQSEQDVLLLAKRRSGDGFNGALVAAVHLDAMLEFFARVVEEEEGSSASLVGADGSLLLRYPPVSDPPPTAARLIEAASRASSGVYRAPATFDDGSRFYGFSQLEQYPAFAVFGLAEEGVYRDWLESFILIGALLSIAALLAFAASTQAVRRTKAEERQRQLAFDRHLLEEAQRAAETRGALLREAHHRIKNNLQMMLSLIRSKSAARGAADDLKDIENRVLALSHVHDLLYNAADDGSKLDLGQFIEGICRNPSIVPPETGVELTCDVEPLEMDVAQAVPIALITVEILTNSLKHAFPDGRKGRVEVKLQRLDESARISIRDDGIGKPAAETRTRSSGLRLIQGLARQLQATLEVRTDHGTEFRLDLPLDKSADTAAPASPA